MKLEFSSRAEADLWEILDYISRKAGADVAYDYGQKIRTECLRICLAPGMGNRHPVYRLLRKIIVGSHKIFYRIEGDRIVIHRIWDGRRGRGPNLRTVQ